MPTTLPKLAPAGRDLLFYSARTANTFSDTPVTDAELRAVWEMAKWPPTSANTQPLRVVFARSTEAKERIVRHLAEGNRAKTASAPVVAVLAADTEFHEFIPEVFPHRPQMREAFGDPDRREQHARFNAVLQSGYFLLAVRAEGLAAGPMTGFDTGGLDRDLFPEGRYRSLMVVNIGHPGPDAWMDRLPRLQEDDALRWL